MKMKRILIDKSIPNTFKYINAEYIHGKFGFVDVTRFLFCYTYSSLYLLDGAGCRRVAHIKH